MGTESTVIQQEPIVFDSIWIEQFRGFNKGQEIPLNASAVVLSGANGRGKTCVFDAIQWLVLGRIDRLEKLRFRQNEEHIVNRYAPLGSKATVSAKLKGVKSGKLIEAIRIGNYRSSTLQIKCNGEEQVGKRAEEWFRTELSGSMLDEAIFEQCFMSTALLQQDLVREFLSRYTHAQRFEILSRLLGLSVIDEFIEKLAETAGNIDKRMKAIQIELTEIEDQIRKLDEGLQESKTRMEMAPLLTDAIGALEFKIKELGFLFLLKEGQDSKDLELKSIISDISQYRSTIRRLDELVEIVRLHLNKRQDVTLSDIEQSLSKKQEELDNEKSFLKEDLSNEHKLKSALDEAKTRSENLHQLALVALPLLGDYCPVCSQKIDKDNIEKHLQSLLSEQPELRETQASYDNAKKAVLERQQKIEKIELEHKELTGIMESVQLWSTRMNAFLKEIKEIGQDLEKIGFIDSMVEYATNIDQLSRIIEWSSKSLTNLQNLQELTEKAIAALSVTDEKGRFDRLKIEKDHLLQDFEEKRKEIEAVNEEYQRRKDLIELAKARSTIVVKEAFDELEPLTQDLFERLAPHPTFTQLSFSHELYRGRGSSVPQATDPQSNLEISPAVGFSSAQANVAALCYFLAFAFASSEADFGVVLLDDPLQSMDDVNILGFSDLCRFLRKEKQLIIATHEERLSNLLIRKLTPRDELMHTLKIEFLSWNRDGPNIDTHSIETSTTIPVLTGLGSG